MLESDFFFPFKRVKTKKQVCIGENLIIKLLSLEKKITKTLYFLGVDFFNGGP